FNQHIFLGSNFDVSVRTIEDCDTFTQVLQQCSIIRELLLKRSCLVCMMNKGECEDLWCLDCPELRAVQSAGYPALLNLLDRILDGDCCNGSIAFLRRFQTCF